MGEKFPQRLKTLRKRKGLSQQALGDRLGVSQAAVHKWEMGQSEPDMDTLVRLAAFFGLPMDALCSDDPATPEATDRLVVMNRAFRQLTEAEQAQLIQVGRTLFRHAFDPDGEPW